MILELVLRRRSLVPRQRHATVFFREVILGLALTADVDAHFIVRRIADVLALSCKRFDQRRVHYAQVHRLGIMAGGAAKPTVRRNFRRQLVKGFRCVAPAHFIVEHVFRVGRFAGHAGPLLSRTAHCYWMLRKQGKSVAKATQMLEGQSIAYKNELLFQNGINYNELPNWQKRGIGTYWETYEKKGFNPITGKEEIAERRALKVEDELPLHEEYSDFITELLKV